MGLKCFKTKREDLGGKLAEAVLLQRQLSLKKQRKDKKKKNYYSMLRTDYAVKNRSKVLDT